MFKFVIAAMASLMLLSVGCAKPEAAAVPTPEVAADGFIHIGNQHLIAINCGQMCAIVFDDENNQFIALMEDGRKVVFDLNE